jgi:site-specific recombinase XerD
MHTIADEARREKELSRHNIRTIQELLMHDPIDTTMIFTYVLNSGVGVTVR